MLNARANAAGRGVDTLFGVLRQTQINQKYRFMVALKHTIADDAAFREGLERDHDWSMKHAGAHQLQYEVCSDNSLLLEAGAYQTLAQVVDANPAVVATKDFAENLIGELMKCAAKMHASNVYHVCFAPQNIFLRKGSTTPLLLCHGSFYNEVRDVKGLYEGCEGFVAPEVLAGGKATEASDVFSLGKLIEWLFSMGGMTIEYKMLMKKATAEAPEARYRTMEEMKGSLAEKRNMRRGLITIGSALAIALVCVWLYLDFMPQRSEIEFVEPAKKAEKSDPFDETFDPDVQMVLDGDTLEISEKDMEMYTQKAEEIFRRRFDEAAEEKLSSVFDKANRGANEKAILADSKAMRDELEDLKSTLADDIGISSERAAEIAKDVLEEKYAKKKQEQEQKSKQQQSEN